MSNQFDNFGQQLKEISMSINELRDENKNMKQENVILKNQISSLSQRLNILEHKSLECHIEIVGVPEIHNEVCTETVSKIASNLGLKITTTNAFRLSSKFPDKPRKLSVCLDFLEEKLAFTDRVKKQKLTADIIDNKWGKKPIYVNEQITSAYRDLFFKASKAVKEFGYEFIWFKNNKIFAMRNEGLKVIIIVDELSISKIK